MNRLTCSPSPVIGFCTYPKLSSTICTFPILICFVFFPKKIVWLALQIICSLSINHLKQFRVLTNFFLLWHLSISSYNLNQLTLIRVNSCKSTKQQCIQRFIVILICFSFYIYTFVLIAWIHLCVTVDRLICICFAGHRHSAANEIAFVLSKIWVENKQQQLQLYVSDKKEFNTITKIWRSSLQ